MTGHSCADCRRPVPQGLLSIEALDPTRYPAEEAWRPGLAHRVENVARFNAAIADALAIGREMKLDNQTLIDGAQLAGNYATWGDPRVLPWWLQGRITLKY